MTKVVKKEEELQIIPAQLSPVLKDTKIELSKAESHAMAFAPSMGSYLELAEKLKGLSKDNPTETDAKIARENRLKMVKVRTSAEEIKDLRKEGVKAEGDLIQALYNVVKNSCIITETEFAEIEKFAERREQERQTALLEARVALLSEFGTDTTSYLPLGIMTDEQFDRLIENERLAFNARKEAAEKAEQARIEAERLAEDQRKEAERLQAERIEAERLEAIRVKAELAAREAELAEERRVAEEKEKARLEAEKKAIEQRAMLNRRFEQYILKEISALGFEPCDDGIKNKELGWFIGKRHYFGFDNEQEAIEWFKETKERVRIMTEQAEKEAANVKAAMEAEAKLAEQKRLAEIEAKKLADIAAEQKRKADAELAKQRAESDKLAAELQARKDAEAKIESDRLAAEKYALLAPDKEKVRQLHTALKAIVVPEFATPEGKEIGQTMREALDILIKGLVQDSKKLL